LLEAGPILYAKKKDAGERLCVDYRALNKATVKNQYRHSFISTMLDGVIGARISTTLDLCGACNRIRSKEGDEYKMAI
jgi:hypothetical protein